jgi:glucoside 3-dehydrogenase (cytochrome c) hitch-hiker subunit
VTPPMNRRDAVKVGTTLVGAALFASSGVLAACERSNRDDRARGESASAPRGVLSYDDQALMEEIADTLLPDTPASPGAKAAGVGAAIQVLLTDCYEPAAQQRLIRGLTDFRATCRARQGADFASLPRTTREQLLRDIDAEARKAADAHWFTLAREVAEGAYFSSETGMTKALRYVRIPGHFTGCLPLAKGQPAWG